jgi:hypothetical protein
MEKASAYGVTARQAQCLAVAVVLALVLTGCERAVPRTDYLPLRDGNRWEYRLLDMPLLNRLQDGQAVATAPASGGAPDDEAELAPKAEVVNPEGETKTAPAKTTARRVALELRDAVDELTYRALYDTAEQVWSKRNGYVGFQSARGRNYLLILPPHSGYRWIVTGPAGQDLFFEIETASATVGTPAGTFQRCAVARQETRERREVFRYWFAPDVGLVRRSKYVLDQEVFRQELVEYSVKPATPATRTAEAHEVRRAVEGKERGTEFRAKNASGAARRLESVEPAEYDRANEKVRTHGQPR